jgi:hypothetical protein
VSCASLRSGGTRPCRAKGGWNCLPRRLYLLCRRPEGGEPEEPLAPARWPRAAQLPTLVFPDGDGLEEDVLTKELVARQAEARAYMAKYPRVLRFGHGVHVHRGLDGIERVVLPPGAVGKPLKTRLLHLAHDDGSHLGPRRVARRLWDARITWF